MLDLGLEKTGLDSLEQHMKMHREWSCKLLGLDWKSGFMNSSNVNAGDLSCDYSFSTMGKSPGKWIKTVLFGKKTSKSNIPKGKELKNSASQKENLVRENAAAIPALVPPAISSNVRSIVEIDESVSRPVNKEPPAVQQNAFGTENQSSNLEASTELNTYNETERENAATKTQAAFRGYLARRAFKALKGIIRLQALIRGHLVRRQAISTLHCLMGIIKLQAIARGANIRCSDIGLEVQKVCVLVRPEVGKPSDSTTEVIASQIVISSTNVFVRNLLAARITVMPLRVQYDPEDPSSVLNWLERWSSSNVWKPAPQPKKAPESKSHKKQGQVQTAEVEHRRPKHSVRRVRGSFDGNASHSDENPRRLKKSSSHPTEPVPENPQHELEKVKRSLRKVHTPAVNNNTESEGSEKPKHGQGKVSISAKHDVAGTNEINPPGKELSSAKNGVLGANETVPPAHVKDEKSKEVDETIEETVVVFQHAAEVLNGGEHLNASETIEISNGNHVMVESPPMDSCKKDPNEEELKSNEDHLQNENQKSSRRSSFAAKQEPEDGPQNTPKVPSYMAATQSAKAKLKGQNSPRLSQDGNEKISVIRRHSLPTLTNAKVSSSSPRTQKPLNGSSGKGGSRSDKARDGKASQTEWRR
ncbi:hypothetical protein V2J09_016900 [Rumex salicifolius]